MNLDDVLKIPPSRILQLSDADLNIALSTFFPQTRPAEHKPINNAEAARKAAIKKKADQLMSLDQINSLISKLT